MGLLATELLSPPCMAPELLWPGWRCHDTAAPGPHLPACPTVAAAANPRAEGDKLPEGASPAPASTVVTLRSPSMVPRKWGDRRVPVPFRDLKAKLPLAMEIQNPKGETRPQHCRPCPPSRPVPQFPKKSSISLGCPPWSSAEGSAAAPTPCPRDASALGQQTEPGMDVAYPPSVCPHHHTWHKTLWSQSRPGCPMGLWPLPVPGSAARRRGRDRAVQVPAARMSTPHLYILIGSHQPC